MEPKNWHDRNYKKLLIIPLLLLVFSIGYLIYFNSNHDSFINKDISLTGGTSITVFEKIDITVLENAFKGKLKDVGVRELYEITTGEQIGVEVKTTDDLETAQKVIEDYLGYELINGDNADIISAGSSFSEDFYKQLITAVIIAFAFMAIVVFIIFRTFTPSMAVIISAFMDILLTLVMFNMLNMKMSTAGIIAFLMLIGYSVDTDIMLTTRMLKRKEGSLNSRIYGALKTGLTMTLTSFFAMLAALFIVRSFSSELTQIFSVLVIGLGFDIINTWITNVSILKWHMESKK